MGSLKFAIRTLFRTPFITAIAIVSLALGIGATAGIFSVFHQVLLQSLSVPDPSELVNLSAPGPKPGFQSCGRAGDCDAVFSYAMFRDLQKTQTVFTDIAAHVGFSANLAYEAQTSSGEGLLVSGSYFPVLELQPALGRLLNSNDDKLVGESRVVVLSYNYWSSRFGLDPTILDKQVIVNGQSLTIVGVAPKGFGGTTIGMRPAVFVPITLRALLDVDTGWSLRTDYWAYLFARLRPGVTIEAARASLGTQYHAIVNDVEAPLQKDISPQTMARFRAKPILLAPGGRGQSSVPDEAKTPLRLLLGVTAFVLLIACANIANLLLARSAARAGEMAIRLSIGASRARLIGQLLTESLLLAVLGGIAGMVVAHWTLVLVISLLPPDVQHTITFSINGTVILFGIGLTFATGLLFGLFPALHSTRPDLVSTLKNQAGQPSGAKGAARVRLLLATSQIALAMMLLASSGFFVKSLLNVSRVDLGFKVDHVATFGLSPDLNGYSFDRIRLFFQRLEDELRAAPGVTAVTLSNVPILAGKNRQRDVAVQGFKAGPDTDSNSHYNKVGPGYCSALGIPLIAGREFTGCRYGEFREGCPRQPDVRKEVRPRERRRRQVDGMGPGRGLPQQTRHDDRRSRRGCEVQRSEADGPAAILRAVWAGRGARRDARLRAHFRRCRAGGVGDHSRCEAAGAESTHRGARDPSRAGPQQHVSRSHDDDALGGIRASGDATRGDRSLWRPRLYRRTAHARDRPPHGAWSRARPRSRHGAASGCDHDARGSARGPRRRARRRQRGAVDSLSDDRCRSGGAGALGRCARAGRAMRRLHPRAPRVTSGSDEGVEIRVACRDRAHIGPKSLKSAARAYRSPRHNETLCA